MMDSAHLYCRSASADQTDEFLPAALAVVGHTRIQGGRVLLFERRNDLQMLVDHVLTDGRRIQDRAAVAVGHVPEAADFALDELHVTEFEDREMKFAVARDHIVHLLL